MSQFIEKRKQEVQDLYKDLAPVARAFLKKARCNEVDAEDFLQEAFLRLWMKQRYIPKGMELPYLIRMLKNLIIDDFRRTKTKRQLMRVLDEAAYEVAAPEQRSQQVARSLLWEKLKEATRDPKASAFILQVKQGLSLEEIAEQQHAPVGTVAAQISRYRGRFKESFHKAWDASVWC